MSIKFRCKNVSELMDFVLFVAIRAPDNFPKWQHLSFEEAFEKIKDGLETCRGEIGEQEIHRIQRVLAESHEAYLRGDEVKGAHLLQDIAQILKMAIV